MSETALIKLSRLMALRRELDAVANNVANVETTGFKAKRVRFQEYLAPVERAEITSKPERPVSLVAADAGFTDFSKGAPQVTGSPLDVAIDGDAFFVVQTAAGERYTRNGAFTLDSAGRLVTMAGDPVLTTTGPLALSPQEGEARIGADGVISTRQGPRGRLRLVRFEAPQNLRAHAGNLFRSDQPPRELAAGSVRLFQGALEKSNVQATLEMSRLVEINRAYQLVSSLLKEDGDLDELKRLAEF